MPLSFTTRDPGQVLVQQSPGGTPDVALAQSYTTPGKLTFQWDAQTGDLVFDSSAAWPVFSTVLAHKGAWRWDKTVGTLLNKVTKDKRATGSQLAEYARDGGAQVEATNLVTSVRPIATRMATGKWKLRLSWTAAGKAQAQEIGF